MYFRKRVDDSIKDLEKKLDKQREILGKLQQESVMQLAASKS